MKKHRVLAFIILAAFVGYPITSILIVESHLEDALVKGAFALYSGVVFFIALAALYEIGKQKTPKDDPYASLDWRKRTVDGVTSLYASPDGLGMIEIYYEEEGYQARLTLPNGFVTLAGHKPDSSLVMTHAFALYRRLAGLSHAKV